MKFLSTLDKWFTRVLTVLIAAAFGVLVVLVAAQVYVRFFTTNSLTWSEELSTYMMIWVTFLSSILCYRNSGHIWVDNFVNMFRPRVKSVILIIGYLLTLLFLGIVFYGAFNLLPTTSTQLSPANKIAMSYIYLSVPVSFFFTGICVIRNIVTEIGILTGKGGSDK